MPRIRSLHPGQWTDEAFVSCTPLARLLAIGLRNLADDQGVFEWKPLGLKMQLFPADNADVPALLAELSTSDQVRSFEASGKRYGAVRNFRKWQRPEKPKALHPLPDDLRTYVGLSATAPVASDDGSGNEGTPDTDGRRLDEAERQPIDDRSATCIDDASPTGHRMSPQRKEEGGRRVEESIPLASLAPSPRAAPRKRDGLSAAEIDEHFETWWVNYPRKVGRGAARRAYEAALRKAGWDPEPVITPMLLATWDERDGGKFIPHAATWLNQERWRDGDQPRPTSTTPELPLH